MKLRTALAAAAMAAAASIPAAAQGPGYGPGAGYGPGMMGGYGPGMMGGYGPGMMGGYGPGMMGGYGPGMMHGYGRGGYGGGPLGLADLSDEQREKILAVQEENRQKNWATMGQMRSEMFKLRRMYYADKVDANALADQQKKVDDLRREMLKSRVASRDQMEAILTPEQRKQLRQLGPWWLRGDDAE